MKYLFFFNGQLLLLCCKIAIQDFVKGIYKKNKKYWRFHRRDIIPSVFHIELKTIYGIVPQSPTGYNPSIFHRVEKHLQDCATITDRVTDGFTDVHYRWSHRRITHILKRTHVRRVSVGTSTDGSKSQAGFSNFFGAHIN